MCKYVLVYIQKERSRKIEDDFWRHLPLTWGLYLSFEIQFSLQSRAPDFNLESFTVYAAAATAKSPQSCPTLCDLIDGSPPGSPVRGILQARTLEWVAISFSNAWKWKVKVKLLSRVWLLATPWTAAYQTPLSMGFFQARVLEWGAIAFSKTSLQFSLNSRVC